MEKTKVIQIIDSLSLGGAETLAVNLSNALSEEENVQSFLCITRKEGPLKDNIGDQVSYLFLDRKGSLGFSAIFRLKKYIKQHKIGVVHAHSTSILIATFVRILLGKRVKLIWHIHSGAYILLKGMKLRVFQFCARWIDTVICVNQNLFSWLARFPIQNKYLLNNFPSFTNYNKVTVLQGEQGKRIVCLAGLRSEKNHLTLLKAFNRIKEQTKNWTIHIVGRDYQDAYSKSLYDYVQEENLEDQVFFYGQVTDIKNVLEQSEIGVLSSKSEGLPIAVLEYGLAKLAVIITEAGQLGEVVQDERVISQIESPEEYAEKLKNLINKPKFRREIAQNFHNRVIKNYSIESCVKKLEKIYNI